jgi:hypothetical protein
MELRKFIATSIREYLNEQQETQTNLNDNFKKWFSNSKVVNKEGNPMICYHGSNNKDIKTFNLDLTGKNTDSGMFGKGFYFTNNIKYANTYNRTKNGETLKVYLKISNPLMINNKIDIPKIEIPDDSLEDMYNSPNIYSEKFRQFLIENKYDGVIDNMSSIKQFVALYSNQIKSVNNDGSWDISDNNIYS